MNCAAPRPVEIPEPMIPRSPRCIACRAWKRALYAASLRFKSMPALSGCKHVPPCVPRSPEMAIPGVWACLGCIDAGKVPRVVDIVTDDVWDMVARAMKRAGMPIPSREMATIAWELVG